MNTSSDWFYLDGDNRKGPFNADALRQLLNAGVIAPDTWIARSGDAEWRRAEAALSSGNIQPVVDHCRGKEPFLCQVSEFTEACKPLLWAGAAFILYFFLQLLLTYALFQRTQGHREDLPYGWEKVAAKLVWPALLAAAPAVGISVLRRKRAASVSRKGRRSRGNSWATAGLRLLALVICVEITTGGFELTSSGIHLVEIYMAGGGGEGIFFLGLLGITAIFILAAIGSRSALRATLAARDSSQSPSLAAFVAGDLAKVTIVLALSAALYPALMAAIVWPPRENHDRASCSQLIRGIDGYRRSHPEDLALRWYELSGNDLIMSLHFESGDAIGTVDPKLLSLLSKDLPADLAGRAQVLDTWDRPVLAAIDGNGDGIVNIGAKPVEGSATVWSSGWNGVNESGSGDDVMEILPAR